MKTDRVLTISLGVTFLTAIAISAGIVGNLVPGTLFGTSSYYVIVILLTIFTAVLGLIQIFPKLPLVRTSESRKQEYPIKITLEIDEKPVTIEVVEPDEVESIMKVIQHLHEERSSVAAKNTSRSTIKNSNPETSASTDTIDDGA